MRGEAMWSRVGRGSVGQSDNQPGLFVLGLSTHLNSSSQLHILLIRVGQGVWGEAMFGRVGRGSAGQDRQPT